VSTVIRYLTFGTGDSVQSEWRGRIHAPVDRRIYRTPIITAREHVGTDHTPVYESTYYVNCASTLTHPTSAGRIFSHHSAIPNTRQREYSGSKKTQLINCCFGGVILWLSILNKKKIRHKLITLMTQKTSYKNELVEFRKRVYCYRHVYTNVNDACPGPLPAGFRSVWFGVWKGNRCAATDAFLPTDSRNNIQMRYWNGLVSSIIIIIIINVTIKTRVLPFK